MTPQEVIKSLKELALELGSEKNINQKDVRRYKPRLDYYVSYHFGTLGNALSKAGLQNRASSLALKMSFTNEKLLEYLSELRDQLAKDPTEMNIIQDRSVYKKFSDKKFSYKIFRTRFGGVKQALKKLENGTDYKQEKVKDVAENEEKENPEFFQNKNRFFGKAAELHVTAELLYHGFQAAIIPIDEGLDILAVKSNKTFYFQVKHKDLNNNQHISITKSSFEKRGGGDVYYIFVLLSDKLREFLIIPYHIVNDWIRIGLAEEKDGGYSFLIKKVGNDYKLRDVILNKYLDRWEDVK